MKKMGLFGKHGCGKGFGKGDGKHEEKEFGGKHGCEKGFGGKHGKHGWGKHGCGGKWKKECRHDKPAKCQKRGCEQKRESHAADFVQDVNLPDGAVVLPGPVTKQWQLKNTGSVKWPEGAKMIFLRGNRELLGEIEEFSVPLAEPNQTVEVACPILVPQKPGQYSAFFQLANKDRDVFGHRFWVELVVNEETKQPVPEAKVKLPEPVPEAKAKLPEPVEDKKVVQGLSSTIPAEVSKHGASLAILEKMGFVNEKLNISLLERAQGNVEQVVSWLLEMESSMPR
jgi:hypothetical protein